MRRFVLTPDAEQDLDGIVAYLRGLPPNPAIRIARDLEQTLILLEQRPKLGRLHENFSKLRREPIRSFACGDYVCYYADRPTPLLLGMIHGRRDVASPLLQRLQ